MQEPCSCGALPPDDARFCHKCGRPLFEADRERIEEVASEAEAAGSFRTPKGVVASESTAEPAGVSKPITFRNSRAVIVTLLVAGAVLVTSPLVALIAVPLFPIYLCVAGAAAVRIYRAPFRGKLTPGAGAYLGWMTGFWLFLILLILLCFYAIVLSSPDGWAQLRAAWASRGPAVPQMPSTQHELIMNVLSRIPLLFLFVTMLPGLGGLLGARFFSSSRSI